MVRYGSPRTGFDGVRTMSVATAMKWYGVVADAS